MTKSLFRTIVALLFATVFTACDQEGVLPSTSSFNIEQDKVSVSSIAQTVRLKVTYDGEIKATTSDDWLKVSVSSEKEQKLLTIAIDEYMNTEKDRDGEIMLSTDNLSARISVHQSRRGVVYISENSYEVSSAATDLKLQFRYSTDFKVIIPETAKNWISLKATKAELSDSTITLSIEENQEWNYRESDVYIELTEYGTSDTIHIFQDEGEESLRILLRDDESCSLFYQALVATHMIDSIRQIIDESYLEPAEDSTLLHFLTTGKTAMVVSSSYERDYAVLPDNRYFKYTVFAVQNEAFRQNGIVSLENLREYAHALYGDEDGAFDDMTSRQNSLNRLVSYHILPEALVYHSMNVSNQKILDNYRGWKYQDVADFYETMMPHSIMRISTPYVEKSNRFINRKGVQEDEGFVPGVRIINPTDKPNCGINGYYYYVNDVLRYDNYTRDQILNTRMRLMGETLSPDFFNSGASRRYGEYASDRYLVGYRHSYCRNFSWSDDSEFYVRYADPYFSIFMGSELMFRGNVDVAFKLPPVPSDGGYEIRYPYNAMAGMGTGNIVQFSLREGQDGAWIPCGDPFDLKLSGSDPSIGYQRDADLKNGVSEEEGLQRIRENEEQMRKNGYMKAPSLYGTGGMNNLRDDMYSLRKIVCQGNMSADKDYYLRIQKVGSNSNSIQLNYLEIVPLSLALSGNEDPY